jgi:hypothetical protein
MAGLALPYQRPTAQFEKKIHVVRDIPHSELAWKRPRRPTKLRPRAWVNEEGE